MTRVITAVYDSNDQVANVLDELLSIASGPREPNRVDEQRPQIQVIMPDVTEADVEEILRRYSPQELRA